jgi:lipase maturation factor 1
LQLVIGLTGNYGFFNLLTVALCVAQLDDLVFPARIRKWFGAENATHRRPIKAWRPALLATVVGAVFVLSLVPFLSQVIPTTRWPGALLEIYQHADAFQSVNRYGLFAVMTTRRPEIVIEGSNDGEHWYAYEFRWKPGDPHRRPRFTGLHLPRLDWQMWFAALQAPHRDQWFDNFLHRLEEAEPAVLGLLETNPFPDRPPRFLRAVIYDYRFSDWQTRERTGAWWVRQCSTAP